MPAALLHSYPSYYEHNPTGVRVARDGLPFKATIERPCRELWAAMAGGARERHCELCHKQVHNFAAMTSREIDRLVREADGKLCARIWRRGSGSLVTLDARSRASVAAQIVASTSLAIGAAGALARSSVEQAKPAKAVLTGTVLKPDGSGPVEGAVISLRASNSVVATARSNQSGSFRIAAAPATYDVVIRQNVLFGTQLFSATLHDGDQSLERVKTHFYCVHDGSPYENGVTMGILVSKVSYTFGGAVRHPWSYLKHLVRKILITAESLPQGINPGLLLWTKARPTAEVMPTQMVYRSIDLKVRMERTPFIPLKQPGTCP
jgi:hypothetical protein